MTEPGVRMIETPGRVIACEPDPGNAALGTWTSFNLLWVK